MVSTCLPPKSSDPIRVVHMRKKPKNAKNSPKLLNKMSHEIVVCCIVRSVLSIFSWYVQCAALVVCPGAMVVRLSVLCSEPLTRLDSCRIFFRLFCLTSQVYSTAFY